MIIIKFIKPVYSHSVIKLIYRKALNYTYPNCFWQLLSLVFKVQNKMNNVMYVTCFLIGQFGSVHI